MITWAHRQLVLSPCFGFVLIGVSLAAAQPADSTPHVNPVTKPPAAADLAVPPLPPVDFFRQLLAMSPMDRERALAGRPMEKRAALRAKIEEYSKMPASDRERRLRMTELRFFLMPLMKRPPSERKDLLSEVPAHLQQLIAERLRQWDLLPEPVQNEVLDHQVVIHYFARLETGTAAEREQILQAFPAERRASLEAEIKKLREMPLENRQKMYERFSTFFDLPPDEKEKTLDVLSDEERREMEKALARFGQLPAAQRELFIESFQKFTNMTSEERDQFLRNAERWRAMSASERQTWIRMVNLLPVQTAPPLPTGPRIPGSGGSARPPGDSKTPSLPSTTNKLPRLPGSGK